MNSVKIDWEKFREAVCRDHRIGTCYAYQVVLGAIKSGVTDLSEIPNDVLPFKDVLWATKQLNIDPYDAKL